MNVFLRQTNCHVAQGDPKQSTKTGINQDESLQSQSGNRLQAKIGAMKSRRLRQNRTDANNESRHGNATSSFLFHDASILNSPRQRDAGKA